MSAEYINLGSVSSHSTKTRISDPQDPPSLYDGLPVLPPRSSSGNLQTHTNHDKEELSLPTYENQPAIVGTIFTDQSSVLRHPLPTQPNSIDALRSGFAAATRNHGLNRNASHEVPKPIATAHYERPAESYTPAGLPNTGSITSGEYTSEPAVSAGVAAVDRVDAFADGAPFLAPNTYSKTLGNGGEGGQHSAQIARIPFSRPDAALEIFTPLTPWLYTSKGGQIKTKYESGYDPGVGTVGLLWSRQAGKLYLPVQNRLISRIWDFVDPPHSRSAAVSPDGVWVLSVDDNRAFMQEGKTRVPLYSMTRLDAEEYGVTTPVFSPDSQNYILASGTQCSLHHAKSGSPKFWLRPQPKHCFTSFAFSPNSERFVSGSDDGVIRLWSSETGGLLYQLSPRGLCGRDHPSVAYSPLGRTFASLGLYGSPGVGGSVLRLFDTLTGQETTNVTIKSSGVPNSVSFSPDGRQVAVLGWTGIVRLDIDSGKRLSHLGGAPSHDPYTASAFSPDGTILVTCNSALQIWDTKTNQLRMVQYEGHNFPDLISGGRPLSVNTITFSPNSAKVATTAKVSQYVRLFDVT
ncbi:WD40 repeat-like protein [Lophium mytilinum]|uniref:WD40 repeat-like protein n=1 Tax=Lophium mytilinum TaxID=390894 RepID=A0A6A6QAQ5_9PEZI|nr:WD40 repeat-like protein [Lophium mytilinum]